MIHLTADVKTMTTQKEFRPIEKSRSDFLQIRKLDTKLQNPGGHAPDSWYRDLDVTFAQWNLEFVQQNGAVWNSKANCQQYARYMASKLGVPYPPDVSVGGDVMPEVIDWMFYGMSAAQNMSPNKHL